MLPGGDKKGAEELKKIFINQLYTQTERLRICLNRRDYIEIKDVAHRLRSSFIYFNLPKITKLSKQIELITDTTFDAYIPKVNKLINMCLEVQQALKSLN